MKLVLRRYCGQNHRFTIGTNCSFNGLPQFVRYAGLQRRKSLVSCVSDEPFESRRSVRPLQYLWRISGRSFIGIVLVSLPLHDRQEPSVKELLEFQRWKSILSKRNAPQ